MNNLGTAYMNQQQFERALKAFRDALALDPKLVTARLNEGIALLNLQQLAPAEHALVQASHQEPSSAHAWYNLGLLYKNTDRAKLAVEAFLQATRLAPQDPDAFYFLGMTYSQLGQDKDAIAAFQQALQLEPSHASAEFGLARSYQRGKDPEQARQHLQRFRQITESKIGRAMGVGYGDQGPLSLALQVSGVPAVLPAIPVKFVDITARSGLAGGKGDVSQTGADGSSQPAACFLDYDNDGKPDVLLISGALRPLKLYHNIGSGHFEDATANAGLPADAGAISCAAGDYDNDGFTDLAIGTSSGVLLFRNDGKGRFADKTSDSKLNSRIAPAALMFADIDHDGDLDLYVLGGAKRKNESWRNNGDGTFTDLTSELGLAASGGSSQALVTDFNNDRAIDLAVSGSKTALFLNPREGTWPSRELAPSVVPTNGMALADFDKDGWPDIAETRSGTPALAVLRNREGKSVDALPVATPGWIAAWGVAALDFDNDGWIDIAAIGETADHQRELRLFRNLGPKGFKDVSEEAGLSAIPWQMPLGVYSADIDGDGDVDLLVTQEKGAAVVLSNEGGNRNAFLRVSLKGLADNKTAIGTKVEVFAGPLWQKWEISPSAFRGQNSTELIVGLGKEKSADVVRLLWPTGVVQDEAQVAVRTHQTILEIDRRGSSCPILFAWDGSEYRFITDMLGAGVIGHWISPTEKNVADSTEYVKLEGVSPRLKNGLLSFRLMEPMEETVYIDQTRLLAIDHPADIAVYPNEYFASNPPFPEFKVIASRNPVAPRGAWDDRGRNVLPQLLQRDRHYVDGFEILRWAGFTKPHSLELELPQPAGDGPLRLLMAGYIEYFTASSMYAAHQAGIEPFAPYVEARTADGRWVRVMDDMGFPAGLPRTMTVDLTGRLPHGTTRIRITTNLQIYWDQVLIDTSDVPASDIAIHEVPLSAAKLAFRGYPRMIEGTSPGDLTFLYDDRSATGPYVRQVGSYTRPGNVRSLVSSVDDKFAVFGSGEELQLDFDPAALPPVKAGWKRDYFFFADGYEKDMDFYAAHGNTVEPLPFHGMPRYPYQSPRQYPTDQEHVRYLLEFNTRYQGSGAAPSYRFEYRRRP